LCRTVIVLQLREAIAVAGVGYFLQLPGIIFYLLDSTATCAGGLAKENIIHQHHEQVLPWQISSKQFSNKRRLRLLPPPFRLARLFFLYESFVTLSNLLVYVLKFFLMPSCAIGSIETALIRRVTG
jgi:hypothetical protein